MPRGMKPKAPPTGDRLPLYVRVKGPPADWRDYEVVFASNGRRVRDCIEANAHEGWYVQRVRDQAGALTATTRKLHAAIRIQRTGL